MKRNKDKTWKARVGKCGAREERRIDKKRTSTSVLIYPSSSRQKRDRSMYFDSSFILCPPPPHPTTRAKSARDNSEERPHRPDFDMSLISSFLFFSFFFLLLCPHFARFSLLILFFFHFSLSLFFCFVLFLERKNKNLLGMYSDSFSWCACVCWSLPFNRIWPPSRKEKGKRQRMSAAGGSCHEAAQIIFKWVYKSSDRFRQLFQTFPFCCVCIICFFFFHPPTAVGLVKNHRDGAVTSSWPNFKEILFFPHHCFLLFFWHFSFRGSYSIFRAA